MDDEVGHEPASPVVRPRARARRVASAAAAVAGVVAVLVVGVVVVEAVEGRTPAPAGPTAAAAPPSPVPTTPPAPATPAPVDALGDLPRGPGPDAGVLVGDTLTEADGRTRLIPPAARQRGITGVSRAGESLLVADGQIFEGTVGLSLVEDDETTTLGPCTTGTTASAPDGRAAWVTFACPESGDPAPTVLVRRGSDGTTTSTEITLPAGTNAITSAVGIIGDSVAVSRGFVDGAFLVGADGALAPVPGVRSLDSISPDGLSALGTVQGGGPTSVVDLATGRVRWRAADLLAFSPDGTVVVGGYDRPTVRAAGTGRVVATFDPPEGVRFGGVPVWEDARHLLVVAEDDLGRSVVRLGLDGLVERAGPPLPNRGQVMLVP